MDVQWAVNRQPGFRTDDCRAGLSKQITTCGTPSTWFPHGRLVKQARNRHYRSLSRTLFDFLELSIYSFRDFNPSRPRPLKSRKSENLYVNRILQNEIIYLELLTILTPYCTILYYTTPDYTKLYYTIPYDITQHIITYDIKLYRTVLYLIEQTRPD